MSVFEVGLRRNRAPGDQWFDTEPGTALAPIVRNKLDSEESRKLHKRLMGWYYLERQKQSANRLEMAMDADFYDSQQWDEEDAAAVRERGQMPLVYNEVAPMVDWLIGTERRARVDWKVLPRSEDDVAGADVRTKVLKYVSDINHVPFARSRAFADAAKVGIGWVDDGARDDPTSDVLYSRYEDWRNIIWDSAGYELDLTDSRYLFRWRWVDQDIGELMFPDRKAQIRKAAQDYYGIPTEGDAPGDDWYLGQPQSSGQLAIGDTGFMADAERRRVRLIECQFREPARVQMVADGPMKGTFFHPGDATLADHIASTRCAIIDRVIMRVHFAVMTESDMLSMAPSIYRHNRYSLTPIWCYRNGKTRLPYGAIRRVRDIQQDLNKRASKALFMLNTNQVIADKGAVDDINLARAEADRPDGWITKNAGKELTIRRDTDAATGQVQMMTLDAGKIQNSVGINNENLGRQSNADSGIAIQARQMQGSVTTTELFDNLRMAVQTQGEKQVSLVEQFYTEAKVLRITGTKGALEWLHINEPEEQPDGSVRVINDITAAMSDFVVSEADYAGTLRQVMFDGISSMASRLPPEVAIKLFIIAMDFSDLPNKAEIADAMRTVIGERDPEKPMTPEDQDQADQQAAAQAEAMQMQRQQASLALEEQSAKVQLLQAQAREVMARAGGNQGMEDGARQVQSRADQQITALTEQLRKVQADASAQIMALRTDKDVALETARIDADTKIRVAEITQASDSQIKALTERLNEIESKEN
jgi:hypothetical protein